MYNHRPPYAQSHSEVFECEYIYETHFLGMWRAKVEKGQNIGNLQKTFLEAGFQLLKIVLNNINIKYSQTFMPHAWAKNLKKSVYIPYHALRPNLWPCKSHHLKHPLEEVMECKGPCSSQAFSVEFLLRKING